MSAPAVSVVVLTCNRKGRLRSQLESLRAQTEPCQIVVVDNASSDGTAAFVREAFPGVDLVQMSENAGCAGRNAGVEAARGDIVVTLDDDVLLHRPDELRRVREAFAAHPEFDAINFKILDPAEKDVLSFNWYHPRPRERFASTTFETDYISEGAIAFRAGLFRRTGGYPADFFISHEGYDLAYRILSGGGAIGYSGDVEVVHHCDPNQRTTWRNAYYDTRNYVWLLAKYEPWPRLPLALAFRLATTFVFCARRGQALWWARGVRDAFLGLPGQWRKRAPLQAAAAARLRSIRRHSPGLWYRIRDSRRRAKRWNAALPVS